MIMPHIRKGTVMPKERHLRDATRSVWRRSYETCRNQPIAWWEQVTPAVDALLAELRQDTSETALMDRYWAVGDAPGATLHRHLPVALDPDVLLELEEACFWLRLRELCQDG
jgi:hypothetical protein